MSVLFIAVPIALLFAGSALACFFWAVARGQLDDLERAGGLRICISAGVVACPDHGADAEELLHKADAAMWRARAVGQPVGVGALQDR